MSLREQKAPSLDQAQTVEDDLTRSEPQGAFDVTICTLESFPEGAAQSLKVGLFARALQHAGVSVRIFALDPTEKLERPRNSVVRGSYHGIPFEYTAGRTTRASSLLTRNWLKFWALLVLLWRVRKFDHRRRVMVFFVHDSARLMFLLFACRLMGIRSVLDFCEWMPTMPNPTLSNRIGYERGIIFRQADGIVPVSRSLERKLQMLDIKDVPVFYLSNLIDPTEFVSFKESPEKRPYILWAGSLDQYRDSVRFVLRAFALVHQAHPEVVLVLCGGALPESIADMLSYGKELGLTSDHIALPGFVSRQDLLAYYHGASALLAPLENDERSRARFPFKLGEYLLTGRPVVSSRVGDVPDYLRDKENALLAEPEDPESFSACINWILENPNEAATIGHAGIAVAKNNFDFRNVGSRLVNFFCEVAGSERS